MFGMLWLLTFMFIFSANIIMFTFTKRKDELDRYKRSLIRFERETHPKLNDDQILSLLHNQFLMALVIGDLIVSGLITTIMWVLTH